LAGQLVGVGVGVGSGIGSVAVGSGIGSDGVGSGSDGLGDGVGQLAGFFFLFFWLPAAEPDCVRPERGLASPVMAWTRQLLPLAGLDETKS
jgi:hypothetical protein